MPILIIKSKGKSYNCLYSSKDQGLISQFHWNLHSKGYAVGFKDGKQILMHRLILGILDKPEIETDHRFHNKLDNRRGMIRVCTHSQNRRNSRKLKESAQSQYKGVYRDQNKWHVQIMQGQQVINLGRYRSEITAGKVYDYHARELFRDFAYLNFPGFKQENQLLIPGL